MALDAKQPDKKEKWEDWKGINTATDFQIIMALDHYQTSSATPTATTDAEWIKHIYAYIEKNMKYKDRVEWELPKYCKLWKLDTKTNKWVIESWCDYDFAKKKVKEAQQLPKKQIITDKSSDKKNPYIAYIDNKGNKYYLFYQTPENLAYLTQTIQSLMKTPCVRMSFWDFGKGYLNTNTFSKNIKLC